MPSAAVDSPFYIRVSWWKWIWNIDVGDTWEFVEWEIIRIN